MSVHPYHDLLQNISYMLMNLLLFIILNPIQLKGRLKRKNAGSIHHWCHLPIFFLRKGFDKSLHITRLKRQARHVCIIHFAAHDPR